MDTCRWVIEVVLRPQGRQGFVLLPKRWTVESAPTVGCIGTVASMDEQSCLLKALHLHSMISTHTTRLPEVLLALCISKHPLIQPIAN